MTDMAKRFQKIATAARNQERARLKGLMEDQVDVLLGKGKHDLAMELNVVLGEFELEPLPQTTGIEEMLAEDEVQEKKDFDRQLIGGELPRVQFNSDEDDAMRHIRSHNVVAGTHSADFLRD